MQRVETWPHSKFIATVLAKQMRTYDRRLAHDDHDFGTVRDLSFQTIAVERNDGGGQSAFLLELVKHKCGYNC